MAAIVRQPAASLVDCELTHLEAQPIDIAQARAEHAAYVALLERLGERVMSRTFERQVNELHIRAAILNRFTELGCPQTAAVA